MIALTAFAAAATLGIVAALLCDSDVVVAQRIGTFCNVLLTFANLIHSQQPQLGALPVGLLVPRGAAPRRAAVEVDRPIVMTEPPRDRPKVAASPHPFQTRHFHN